MHEVLVNRLGGLSLPRKCVVRLADRPDMTLDVYRGPKTKMQQQQCYSICKNSQLSIAQTLTSQSFKDLLSIKYYSLDISPILTPVISNYRYLKVNFLEPENLLRDISCLGLP